MELVEHPRDGQMSASKSDLCQIMMLERATVAGARKLRPASIVSGSRESTMLRKLPIANREPTIQLGFCEIHASKSISFYIPRNGMHSSEAQILVPPHTFCCAEVPSSQVQELYTDSLLTPTKCLN